MCIIYIYDGFKLSEDDANYCKSYKLIIAANRDEFYNRPAKPAHFWCDYPHVLAGQDLTEGKEGGTWLGCCLDGRVGMLTNYNQSKPNPEKKGRGQLLSNFFCHQTVNERIHSIEVEVDEYNPFSMLLGDMSTGTLSLFTHDGSGKFKSLTPGVSCMSNGAPDCAWDKVVYGKNIFQDILKNDLESNEEPIEAMLLKLLTHNETFTNDDPLLEIMEKRGVSPNLTNIFVNIPGYGTRTNTIILLDHYNNCTFYEKTMICPIDGNNPEWTVNKFNFKVP